MSKVIQKLPLLYLILLAVVGVIMRSMTLVELPFNFVYIRHAHSHLAFLGWVYTAFYVLIWQFFLQDAKHIKFLSRLFWVTQLSIVGMFIGFWSVGYQPISIAFMVVHTILAYRFIAYIRRHIEVSATTRFLMNTAFGFFVLSSISPFFIPVIKVMEKEEYMTAAVNFYLHFHYNGWFIFGIFALLSRFIELGRFKKHFIILIGTTLLAYFELLYLYNLPQWLVLLTSLVIILQWFIVFVIVYELLKELKDKFSNIFNTLLTITLSILGLKYTIQVFGILPTTWFNFEFFSHFNVIGYLHLLFLGVVTPIILAFYQKLNWLHFSKFAWSIYGIGWILTEVGLFLMGTTFIQLSTLVLFIGISGWCFIVSFRPNKRNPYYV